MTNIKTAFGASIWSAIAATLMLATFEPVSVEAPHVYVAALPVPAAAA